MKDLLFNNQIVSSIVLILTEILRYLVWIPLIVLLVRWVKIVLAKRDVKKPFALLTSISGRERHEIKGYETAIGRMKNSDIILNYQFISRNHAVIAYRNSKWYLFDTASAGGCTVNSRKIRKPTVIKNGDTIGFAGLEYLFSPAPEQDPDRDIYSYKNFKEQKNKNKRKGK